MLAPQMQGVLLLYSLQIPMKDPLNGVVHSVQNVRVVIKGEYYLKLNVSFQTIVPGIKPQIDSSDSKPVVKVFVKLFEGYFSAISRIQSLSLFITCSNVRSK